VALARCIECGRRRPPRRADDALPVRRADDAPPVRGGERHGEEVADALWKPRRVQVRLKREQLEAFQGFGPDRLVCVIFWP